MSVIHRLSARPFGRGVAIVAIGMVAAATLASAPVGAASSGTCTSGPVLDLANPSAGDLLSSGDYIVSGVAHDPSAASGDGIDRVDLFVGNRDLGGTEVGSAVPQQGTFEVTAKLPTNITGETSFFAYAHSSVTGAETSVSVPVFLGAAPTPTPHSSTDAAAPAATPVVPAVASASCMPANASQAAAAPATTTGSMPAPMTTTSSTAPAASVTAALASGAPVLQVGNPSPGDTLLLGDYIISGLAYVPNSAQGIGVDRVDFFLGNRDQGGTSLGSAVPGQSSELSPLPTSRLAMGGFSVKVTIPSSMRGNGTTFYAYAQNSVTGQESVYSAPVFVGAPPTPTPRPSTSS